MTTIDEKAMEYTAEDFEKVARELRMAATWANDESRLGVYETRREVIASALRIASTASRRDASGFGDGVEEDALDRAMAAMRQTWPAFDKWLSDGGLGFGEVPTEPLEAALRALRPAPAVAGEGWQTIESAPKDGTEILGFIPGSRIGHLQEEPDIIDAVFWKSNTGGWRHRSDDHIHLNVTHWQPLPASPSTGDPT